jgi:hypothetical protein
MVLKSGEIWHFLGECGSRRTGLLEVENVEVFQSLPMTRSMTT